MSIHSGDGRFEALYRKNFSRVYRFYRAYGVADDEAQDLAQETFKRIYESFDDYRGEAEWGFIQTTARNVLFNWVRAAKTAKRSAELVAIDDPELMIDPPAPPEPDYAERQHAEQRRKRLVEAVAALPPGQRECLRLWMVGFKYNEIAAILKTTVDAVKSRLRDAKKELRERLGDES
jgi:RNA polymerase sigma-70 factor (ECF subfamily)